MESDTASISDVVANPTYRFLHDRVQQAAYSLIPEHQKTATHLKIGQLLQENCSEIEQEEKLFDIVGHLNIGKSLITQTGERRELTQLNLAAGKKARLSTAYDAAIAYFTIGMELLPEDCWNSNYELTLALHEATGEAAYLNGQFEQFEPIAAITLKSAKTLLDKITTYETQIQVYLAQNCLAELMETSLNILSQLGIQLPKSPNMAQILLGLAKTKLILAGKKTPDLLNLPIMSSPEKLAAMRMLSSAINGAFISGSKLFPLLVFQQVNLSVRFGNMPLSAYAYSCYGIILCGVLGDINQGYGFGQLALQILGQFNAKDLRSKTLSIVNGTIFPWKQHLRSTLLGLQEGYQIGLETGDLESAYACISMRGKHLYWCGSELLSLAQTLHHYSEMMRQTKQHISLMYTSIYHQATLNLIGESSNPSLLEGSAYSATQNASQKAAGDRTGLFFYYVNQTYLSYLFGEVARACQQATLAQQYVEGGTALYVTVPFYLYDSLSRLGLYPHSTKSEQRQILDRIAKNQQKLHRWASFAPMNHQHKWCLVEAERYRVLGRNTEAMEMYDRAITLAKANQFVNEEALANELAAKFYLDWGKEKIAQTYMIEAYYCYTRWGAKAKTEDLETRYPQLLATILQKQQPAFKPTETMISVGSQTIQTSGFSHTSLCETFDLATILKASQSLSSEIELEKLLSTLVQVILESAGADKCALLMPRGSHWVIEALSQLEQPAQILRSLPFDDGQTVPVTLINRVKNTLSLAVIENAIVEPTLAADPYMIRHSPKSILCAPIVNQGKLIGILYLENNLTVGAFTRDRLQVLNLLTTQAAISLENAQLYHKLEEYSHTLEQKVEERTQEITEKATQLELTLEKLYSTQSQLIQAEKMSGLGQLVAGIAHEINNPINFIYGNLQPASEYVASLIELNNLYQKVYPQPLPEIADKIADIELEFISNDLQKLLSSMRVGAARIRQIVLSLRNFSRLDESEIKPVDIHSGIDSTLLILQHRLQSNSKHPEIAVIPKYGQLPLVNCYASALNQVFMNLINNAIDALEESDINRQPTIIIQTEFREAKNVVIRIADNGIGMSESVQNKMFNPFFTTKPIGSATGLGLSTSYSIVVEKHGGKLSCISAPGKGTEFIIEIPL
ncbi:MAG: ATP-binding protein [Nostoc sp.]